MDAATSNETPARTLPDRIADELIARIFTGTLAAGARLPPERVLAAELGVDRTSLRIALRQLIRMRLLQTTQGSGALVLDFRESAGLDFLASVLEIPGLELGSAFLLEALDLWERALPRIALDAFTRATPAELAEFDTLFRQQLAAAEAGEDIDTVAALGVELQDRVIAKLGDVTLRLIANSTRRLRLELHRRKLQLGDAAEQIARDRKMFEILAAAGADAAADALDYPRYLADQHRDLRAHIRTLPRAPWRTSRWTRNP